MAERGMRLQFGGSYSVNRALVGLTLRLFMLLSNHRHAYMCSLVTDRLSFIFLSDFTV